MGQRDLGLVAWLLAQIADQMVMGDAKGAMELMGLTLVAVEQAAHDNGRWELAWMLALQEEPPQGVFQGRGQQTNPRVRAFAPLCPTPWTTMALAYLREMELITNRRLEALPGKKSNADAKDKEDQPNPKRKPRYPKKAKALEDA